MKEKIEGVELCPSCQDEIEFAIDPHESVVIVCPNCGEKTIACSLCSRPFGCQSHGGVDFCKRSILESIRLEQEKDC